MKGRLTPSLQFFGRVGVEKHEQTFWSAIVMAAAIGVGQLLSSKEPITMRLVTGRAICSGGIGAVSALALLAFPDMSFAAQMGLAAALASLGTSAVEKLLQRFLK